MDELQKDDPYLRAYVLAEAVYASCILLDLVLMPEVSAIAQALIDKLEKELKGSSIDLSDTPTERLVELLPVVRSIHKQAIELFKSTKIEFKELLCITKD